MNQEFHLNKAQQTLEQELAFSSLQTSLDEWLQALSAHINKMVVHEFPKLVGILYRLDIDETQLSDLLKSSPATNAGDIIGKLLIKRQLEKILSRENYTPGDVNISDDEKW